MMKAIGVILAIGTLCASHSASAQYFGGPASGSPGAFSNSGPYIGGRLSLDTNRLYASGYADLKAGRYAIAAQQFEQAASDVLAKAEVTYMAGATNYLIGNDEKAAAFLRSALRGGYASNLTSQQRKLATKMLNELRHKDSNDS